MVTGLLPVGIEGNGKPKETKTIGDFENDGQTNESQMTASRPGSTNLSQSNRHIDSKVGESKGVGPEKLIPLQTDEFADF